MGRPPKSVEERRANGNAGKRPLESQTVSPRPDPGTDVPPAPKHLNAYAAEMWSKHAPELHRLHLLTTIDVSMFEMLCTLYGNWRRYEELADKVGPEMAVQMGYRGAADRAIEKAKAIAEKFGLEPKSRGSIKTIPVGGQQTALPFAGSPDKSAQQLRSDFRLVGRG